MKRKFLIFTFLIFIMAVGAVSAQDANDTSTAIENQDILSTDVGGNDILGEAQHTGFSIGNSTSSDISDDVLISAPDLEKYYHGPERFAVNLTDKNGNAVSNAYNKAEYIEQRRKLMQWWADYLDCLREGKETPKWE